MPRNVSFFETQQQFFDRSKDVTRRIWKRDPKAGDVLCGVEKSQGIPKGGKINKLGLIKVVSIRRERLDVITQNDVRREGFPKWTVTDFITFFCKMNKCTPDQIVTRLEYRYLQSSPDRAAQRENFSNTAKADAKARINGKNLDGSARRETVPATSDTRTDVERDLDAAGRADDRAKREHAGRRQISDTRTGKAAGGNDV